MIGKARLKKISTCFKTGIRTDNKMDIKWIYGDFTVCKLPHETKIDINDEFYFIAKTDEELSLVCRTTHVPDNVLESEDGWVMFRIEGVLDFQMVGVLAKVSSVLAQNGISIFAISTFNTDYIMTKYEHKQKATDILNQNGYTIKE